MRANKYSVIHGDLYKFDVFTTALKYHHPRVAAGENRVFLPTIP
jgi:hypothetical protein